MLSECTIVKKLAQGGQKTVFLAAHPKIGHIVIKKGSMKSFGSLERIRREIELLSDLRSEFYPSQFHFNIDVKTKEFEIAEEYIIGAPLRSSMHFFRGEKDILQLLLSLAKGLSIVWERNIVHRDLKPENIIIRPDGTPCIIDLGIARFLDLDSLTQTISPVGPCTPIYAAPEQLTNNKAIIDPRTDFFSLGIIALELYLGIHPFDSTILGDGYSIVENILRNRYFIETATTKKSEAITEFAARTLMAQPFERFRNHRILTSFLEKNLV